MDFLFRINPQLEIIDIIITLIEIILVIYACFTKIRIDLLFNLLYNIAMWNFNPYAAPKLEVHLFSSQWNFVTINYLKLV
jgi:hypothetical protein